MVTGRCYLGGSIEEFVAQATCLEDNERGWEVVLWTLVEVLRRQPQDSYAVVNNYFQQEWCCVKGANQENGEDFRLVDK